MLSRSGNTNSRGTLRISYVGPLYPSEHNNVNCGDNFRSQYSQNLGFRRKFARLLNDRVEIQRRFANRGEMMKIGENDDYDDDDRIATIGSYEDSNGTLRIRVA